MPSKPVNRAAAPESPARLYVVATPIGNLADITIRALDTLRTVHFIAAEDTRHTRKLLSYYDIHRPLTSYHSHNAQQRGPELLKRVQAGESVALVTDAGTPGISDPGYLLIEQAIAMGILVEVVPGPTALITALVASGLPTHPFAFLGFAPARGSGRRRFFESYAGLPMTLVLYESPQRLQKTLEDILTHWGDRRMAVARELTKQYEEIFRGVVSEACGHFPREVKGELTLVVAGREEQPGEQQDKEDWKEELRELILESQMSVREVADRISDRHRLPRRMVYQEALRIKGP